MKTNKILGTLALAALAAACSNEEFEAVNNSPAQNGRVELGQISLTVAGTDTRWDIGANFNDLVPVVGDALGACLVDAPNAANSQYSDKDAKYNYDLTDYISTNYAFKFDGSKYVSEAKMVEGNYVFYAPYNAAHATRKPIVAKLNPVQQLNAAEDGSIDALSTIKQLNNSGEVVLVGHKFIGKDDGKSVSAVLKPIYAYPLITLKNSYKPTVNGTATETDLVINQIVLKNAGGFMTKASLDFCGAAGKTAISATAGVVSELRDFTYWYNDDYPSVTMQGDWIKGKGNSTNYTADVLNTVSGTSTSSAIIVKTPENAWTLAYGQSTQFYAVVPAAAGAVTEIYVYTNKGVFKKVVANGGIGVGKRYPIAEYDENGSLKQPSEGGAAAPGDTYKFNITTGSANASASNVVASSADLATLIASAPSSTTTLKVSPLNADVEINSAVASAFSARGAGFSLEVDAPITIAASLTSANKTVKLNADATVKSGTITLGSCVKVTTDGKKIIVKGGDVTVEAKFDNSITNADNSVTAIIGSLEVQGGKVTLKSSDAAAEITKAATLTLASTANNKTIKANHKDAKIELVAGTDEDHILNYAATINVTKGSAAIPANTTLKRLENSADGSVENKGTITSGTNNGTVTNGVRTADGVIKNYGTITNIVNDGLIEMLDADAEVSLATSTVSSGDQVIARYGYNGMIKNNIDATAIRKNAATNIIYYEFTTDQNGKLIPQCSNYDEIFLTNMTWTVPTLQTITKKIRMRNATISAYDPDAEINLAAGLYTANDDNKSSYIKGNASAKINIANGNNVDAGVKRTGVIVNWNWIPG